MATNTTTSFQGYAMTAGTLMGVYWIIKFILFPAGFVIPFLQLLFIILTIAVPFIGYFLVRRYRNRYSPEGINFFSGFTFTFSMYFYASMLAAVAHFIYFRFIDQGFIFNSYLQQIDEMKRIGGDEVSDFTNNLTETINTLSSFSPIQLTFQLFSQNILYTFLLAIITGLLVKNKKTQR
ncbi:DUF4199 domain-containing protein [uncultured Bacteroides sp.]|uniref:DUF4199 domain-containing protein n=1 Tax=uncultured Bacteroides sp. TaxID=162156 RepID=UPI00262002C8|nr:DUF4199 domain-containing protein [uncultured Bacteroides sp.]